MTVHDLAAHRVKTDAPAPLAANIDPNAKTLLIALAIIRDHGFPAGGHQYMHGDGQQLTFDLTHCQHPSREMGYLSSALGLVVEEFAAETADGCAAIELRASRYEDGVLLTIRATVPIPATFPSLT